MKGYQNGKFNHGLLQVNPSIVYIRIYLWAGYRWVNRNRCLYEVERKEYTMIFDDRTVFVENFHVFLLARNWLKDQNSATGIEFLAYLSVLSSLGKSN